MYSDKSTAYLLAGNSPCAGGVNLCHSSDFTDHSITALTFYKLMKYH
jgi:hypothetical protein